MTIKIRIRKSLKEELNGRLLLFVDNLKSDSKEYQLYKRRGLDGAPVFGITLWGLHGGDEVVFDDHKDQIMGFPFDFDEIPHKPLKIQAFFIKYHKYVRGDGHTIWGMQDNGGGCNYAATPYNLYSAVKTIDYGKEDITLDMKYEIKPEKPLKRGQVLSQNNYERKGKIRYFKMKSKLLS